MDQNLRQGIALLEMRGQPAQAAVQLRAALKAGLSGVEEAVARLELGRILVLEHKLDEARDMFRLAAAADAGCGEAHSLLGLVARLQGDLQAALQHVRRGVELQPGSFLTQYNLARILADRGELAEARLHYEQAVEISPAAASAHYELGLALEQLGEPDAALESMALAFRLDRSLHGAALILAQHGIRNGRLDSAEKLLLEAAQASPQVPALHRLLTQIAKMQLDLVKALRFAVQCVQLQPRDAELLADVAVLALANGQLETSERAARAMTEAAPLDWRGPAHLAKIYALAGLPDLAMEHLVRAVELAPEAWQPRCDLGKLMLESDRPARVREGMEHLQLAAELSQGAEAGVLYNLALGHAKLGDQRQAAELARLVATDEDADPALQERAAELARALGGR